MHYMTYFIKEQSLFAFAAGSSRNWYFYFFLLFSFGDHFEWNKVTSCIHNILSGQRWIEHYGEIVIKNLHDDSCYCKVNFIKVTPVTLCALTLEGLWKSQGPRAQGL